MDQAQPKALAALQPFIHHATTTKSPSHRFLIDLITRATSAPGTYVFTELLQTPAIQSLRAQDTPSEVQSHLTLLELFSYGTYEEYKTTPNLPTLTESQASKLRLLSLLTLASPFGPSNSTDTTLTYDNLLQSLSLSSNSALESLIRTAIYSSLLTARLSPNSTPPTVHIHSVAPVRDLRPQSLPAMLQILSTWEARCASVTADLESQIAAIRNNATARSTTARTRQDTVDSAVLAEDTGKGNKTRTRPGKRDLDQEDEDTDDGMDVDDDVAGMVGASGGGAVGTGRGTKRNRGRG